MAKGINFMKVKHGESEYITNIFRYISFEAGTCMDEVKGHVIKNREGDLQNGNIVDPKQCSPSLPQDRV